ncbi:sialate O-acetylesterase [Pseudocolwellia agarivorans]|uniref:sialate O-acetylesterase n=1 Tax=Pseudocolwellia agarivorans TaxID=1911682 RepID=UPI000985EA5F|nr:sialate O-acetylesterase [Pseudocolwellia agarivorans]
MKILLLILSCALCACVSQTKVHSQTEKLASQQKENTISVVLLAGQSNMEGAGNFDALEPSVKQRLSKVSSRVMLSNKGDKAVPLSFTLSPHKKEKYGFEKAFGPELMIGITLAEKFPKKKFLLIKTAYGGTSLYGAWSTNWTAEKAKSSEKGYKQDLPLYKMFQTSIKEQLTLLDQQNVPYKVIGMAWMQGENDAAKEFTSLSYRDNLVEFIQQNRRDTKVADMPFIIGQINSTYGRFKKGPEVVRQAMVDVANTKKNVSIILTTTNSDWEDFPKHTDNTHYNTLGQVRLGEAFANKLLPFIL